MSFRLFIYYCSLCGGCAAYLGWVLGRFSSTEHHVAQAGVKGLFLGLTVALGLSLVDALWNFTARQVLQIGPRVLIAVVLGCVGGFFGGVIGQSLYGWSQLSAFLILGWTFTGFLIGASLGVFDYLTRMLHNEDGRGALKKVRNGLLGGTLGGLLGGVLYLLLQSAWERVFHDRIDDFWSPSATGFVALGLCIGFLIGLAQVLLKEAWLKVEKGFRSGREVILSKPETTIGRAEGCDVGLFGDPGVERLHFRILRRGNEYLVADAGTPGGTFVNEEPVHTSRPLRSGDVIRVGQSVLRFSERQQRGR
jgi:MFS family permease